MIRRISLSVLHTGVIGLKINWTYATKAIVSLLGNAQLLLTQYPHVTWQEMTAVVITSTLVWLVPNTSANSQQVTNTERAELDNLRSQKANTQ